MPMIGDGGEVPHQPQVQVQVHGIHGIHGNPRCTSGIALGAALSCGDT
jgi:hypothetical protein